MNGAHSTSGRCNLTRSQTTKNETGDISASAASGKSAVRDGTGGEKQEPVPRRGPSGSRPTNWAAAPATTASASSHMRRVTGGIQVGAKVKACEEQINIPSNVT